MCQSTDPSDPAEDTCEGEDCSCAGGQPGWASLGALATRRRLLATGAAAAASTLAGCSSQEEAATTAEPTETTAAATETTEPTDAATPEDLAAPVDPVPDGSRCPVCNMKSGEFPEWNAQVSHENGDRGYFCSPGCMAAYYATPSHHTEDSHSQDDIVGIWARDYDSRELIDATAAHYVLEEAEANIDAPMGDNPVPFAEAVEAEAYVDQDEDKTSHDIVSLSAFDVALARRFRANFLPETDDTAVTQSVAVPEDAECAVCNMLPANFPEWNAQLAHEDGERTFFCSPGCMTAYHATPGHFADGASQDGIVGVWVHDHGSGELIDGTLAAYVLETSGERNDGPMMTNPMPYASRADALAYVEGYDDRTREDVVSLSAFDVALASEFRAKHLPEPEDTPITESVAVPEDAECAVCDMMPANFPEWNAQLAHEDGERTFTCSPGCMAAYYSDPGTFDDGRAQERISGVWVHDVASGDLVDGTLAYYVLDTDPERNDGPMMTNPRPYAQEAEAVADVEAYDDLSGEDMVRLQAISREVGRSYREQHF